MILTKILFLYLSLMHYIVVLYLLKIIDCLSSRKLLMSQIKQFNKIYGSVFLMAS